MFTNRNGRIKFKRRIRNITIILKKKKIQKLVTKQRPIGKFKKTFANFIYYNFDVLIKDKKTRLGFELKIPILETYFKPFGQEIEVLEYIDFLKKDIIYFK